MTNTDQLERKLTAILFADVVEYSRLANEDEDGTYRRLRECLDLFAATIENHAGQVIKYSGDAVLADFPTVSDALECAVAVQTELTSKSGDIAEEQRVRFRIGINLGEVIVDRNDIYGDGVNVAARLEGLADPDGICISQSAYSAVGTKLALEYQDIGRQKVKNIAQPIHVYRVLTGNNRQTTRFLRRSPKSIGFAAMALIAAGIAAVIFMKPWTATQTELPVVQANAPPSIAVLPFQTLGAEKSEEYFSDGITNDIITDLSRFSNLLVIASNSVFTYKGVAVDVKKVGRELNVGFVLEGSVQRVGDTVRINAQLIDATSNHHLWADRYDFKLDNIFEVQDKITEVIVSELQVRLTVDEQERDAKRFTNNLEAYDVFLRGRTYLRGNKRAHRKARELFDRAIELDPEFAAAYAEKSITYFPGFIMPMAGGEEVVKKALSSAQRAVDLDPKLPLTHARLSWALFANHRHEDAIVAAKKAIELGPSNAEAHVQFGNLLNWSGQPSEGLKQIKRAMRLNPHYPFYYLFYLGHSNYLLERHDEAIKLMRRVVTRAPHFLPVKRHLAVLYQETGQSKLAEQQVEETLKIFPGASIEDERSRCYYMWTPALQRRFFEGLRKSGMPEGVPGVKPIDM